MNVVSDLPVLQGVNEDETGVVREAIDLLEIVRGLQDLGMGGLNYKDLTLRQFRLVSYFNRELSRLNQPKAQPKLPTRRRK